MNPASVYSTPAAAAAAASSSSAGSPYYGSGASSTTGASGTPPTVASAGSTPQHPLASSYQHYTPPASASDFVQRHTNANSPAPHQQQQQQQPPPPQHHPMYYSYASSSSSYPLSSHTGGTNSTASTPPPPSMQHQSPDLHGIYQQHQLYQPHGGHPQALHPAHQYLSSPYGGYPYLQQAQPQMQQPQYTSAAHQYHHVLPAITDPTGQTAPPGVKPKVTTTLWEDEGTLCFQVEARGICVARREDNDMINGTKLLNVAGMTRGRRDGILKGEKNRHVVKAGAMHLKGVWIPYDRALDFANKEKIIDLLYPLFVTDIKGVLYHPGNYARTAQVLSAAEKRKSEQQQQQQQQQHYSPPVEKKQPSPKEQPAQLPPPHTTQQPTLDKLCSTPPPTHQHPTLPPAHHSSYVYQQHNPTDASPALPPPTRFGGYALPQINPNGYYQQPPPPQPSQPQQHHTPTSQEHTPPTSTGPTGMNPLLESSNNNTQPSTATGTTTATSEYAPTHTPLTDSLPHTPASQHEDKGPVNGLAIINHANDRTASTSPRLYDIKDNEHQHEEPPLKRVKSDDEKEDQQ